MERNMKNEESQETTKDRIPMRYFEVIVPAAGKVSGR